MPELTRPARPDDLPAVARLLSHSFPGPGRDAPGWEQALRTDPRGGPELFWVADQEGELAAACHLLRFEQWVAGAAIPVMGLGKVAVSPVHRRRGVGRRLLEGALRHARERGDLASALYPFRASFYRALGYGVPARAIQYRLEPRHLPAGPDAGRVQPVETDADHAAVQRVYERWIRGQTGQFRRSGAEWEWFRASAPHRFVLYRSREGEPEGYALYTALPAGSPGGPLFQVEERAWLTATARHALYGWMATLGDGTEQVVYRSALDERLDLVLLDEPSTQERLSWGLWRPVATVVSGPMFRLLNLPAALERRPLAAESELTVRLEVPDEQLPENRGPWTLRVEGGAARVAPGDPARADLHLSLSIGTLSGIFFGALTLEEALAAGLAEVRHPERVPDFDRAFRAPPPWVFTRF